jgi:putative Ca2+/H+ antiporter (TMEM165/GDT1 family)
MCTEWGDISQLVVIGLSAKYSMWVIILGGGIAHVLSILIAIVLGSMANKVLNESWMNLIAGTLFLMFAIWEIYVALYGGGEDI